MVLSTHTRIFASIICCFIMVIGHSEVHAAGNDGSVADFLNNDGSFETQDHNTSKSTDDAGPSTLMTFVKLLASLAFILFLIYLFYRFIVKRKTIVPQKGRLDNLGGVPLGNQRSIQLIRIGDEVLVIGVGDEVRLLKTIEADAALSLRESVDEEQQNQHQTASLLLSLKKQFAPLTSDQPLERKGFSDELRQLVQKRTNQLKQTTRKENDDG